MVSHESPTLPERLVWRKFPKLRPTPQCAHPACSERRKALSQQPSVDDNKYVQPDRQAQCSKWLLNHSRDTTSALSMGGNVHHVQSLHVLQGQLAKQPACESTAMATLMLTCQHEGW